MSCEHFDVRRIRDGVTYNTKTSELIAYAEGNRDDASNGRWRAGLYRAASGAYFAVREEAKPYFDQIGGRWLDDTGVSLDLLDFVAAVKWCEQYDANVLVDFLEKAEMTPAAVAVQAEAPAGVVLRLSDVQRSVLEDEAQKAGLSVDAYLLQCVELQCVEAGPASPESETERTGSEVVEAEAELHDEAPAVEAVAAEEVVIAEPVDDEAEDAIINEIVAAEDLTGEPAPAMEAVSADEEAEPLVLTVAEEIECVVEASDEHDDADIVPLSPELIHQSGLAQGGLNGGVHDAGLGKAAE
jgi:hypothetical protein